MPTYFLEMLKPSTCKLQSFPLTKQTKQEANCFPIQYMSTVIRDALL